MVLLKRAGFVESKKEFKNLSRVEQNELITKLEMEMAEAGIDLATTTSVTSDLVQSSGRTFSELSPSEATLKQRFQQLGGRIGKVDGTWGKTKAIGRSLKMGSDTLLWDKWVRNSQVAIYSLLKSRAMKHGLDAESAKRVAGHYTKDLLGMLDKEVFSPDGPMSAETLNFMLFARNWTVSNMRLVSGSLGYRGSNLPRFLSHRGLNKGEMKFLQEQYASHIIKGMIAMLAMTNVGNYFITGTEVDKDDGGKFKGFKFNKDKARWATSNEKGHELDFDTGMKDNKNRQIYVTPPIFRYLRDYYGWFGDPTRTLFNKAHPVGKAMLELLLNMSLWNRQQIVSYPEQKTIPKIGGEVAKHLIYSVTPYGQFAGRPDELRSRVEKIIPWFGTWVRHGVGGGDFAMDINEVLREKAYKRDEIDKEIDLMSQTGDPIGVIQRLIETERYATMDGIERRLLKYQNPLLYKYLLLSKADQVKLLSKYGPQQKEAFFKTLTAGDSTVARPKQ